MRSNRARAEGTTQYTIAMTIDQRDHYIKRLKKKTGYVEKSSFRMSVAEEKRQKKAAQNKRVLKKYLAIIYIVIVIVVAIKNIALLI